MEQTDPTAELIQNREWSGDLAKLLFEGRAQETFFLFKTDENPKGYVIVLRTLDAGEEDQILARCSGLDMVSRQYRHRLYSLAIAIISVEGYNFGTGEENLQERVDYVSNLQTPVFEFLSSLYYDLCDNTAARVKEKLDNIKKSPPDQSPGPSGD